MSVDDEVKSPCINVCRLDHGQVCSGCGRHIDEIAAWRQLDDMERCEVIVQARKRREKLARAERTADQIGE